MRRPHLTVLATLALLASGAPPLHAHDAPTESAQRSHAPWVALELGVSPYDAARELFVAHGAVGITFGYRWTRWGVFGAVHYDLTREFTRGTPTLQLLDTGLGVEWLNFDGRLRSTFAVGSSTLLSDTLIDGAGTTGWAADLRPVAVRWPFGDQWALELTPLSFDVSVPVTEGLPLVTVAYMTLLGVEWSLQ